jgi:hypothetical protein
MDRWNPQRYGSVQGEEWKELTRNRKEWRRPKPTQGCSAAEEEKEGWINLDRKMLDRILYGVDNCDMPR